MQLEAEQRPVSGVSVQFISGPLIGKIIHIKKPVMEIGRDGQNDIAIFDPKVSRFHARIRYHNGSWTIENISQGNFIAINQQRLQQGILQHNCVVRIGEDSSFIFLLQPPLQPSLPLEPKPSEPQAIAPQPQPPAPARRVPANVPRDVSPTGTVIATNGPSLVVSSNIHSNRQTYALKKDVQVFNIGRD